MLLWTLSMLARLNCNGGISNYSVQIVGYEVVVVAVVPQNKLQIERLLIERVKKGVERTDICKWAHDVNECLTIIWNEKRKNGRKIEKH